MRKTPSQSARPARGRYAPVPILEDRLALDRPLIDLSQEMPSPAAFVSEIGRELRLRFYQRKTVKLYDAALAAFLTFARRPPHAITRNDVRCFLEHLVNDGSSSSWVALHLSAIRTAFDKICGRPVTTGLATPRRPRRLPVVCSESEVEQLLQATPSVRDRLLLALMYGTGMRVSEICRLR